MITSLHHRKLLIGISMLATAITANAAVIFQDNFESHALNATLPTGGNWVNVSGVSGGNSANVVNSGTPFGATTKYLQYADTSATTVLRVQSQTYASASNALTTLSFDYFEPATGGSNALNVGYAIDSTDLGTSINARMRMTLNNGTVGATGGISGGTGTSYSMDTAYRFYMIFNDSATSANYLGGSVAAGTAHIWFENLTSNAVTFAGIANAQNTLTSETSYNVAFRTSGADIQSAYIDNVLFETGAAAIPEPGHAFLGCLGGLLLLRRRR